MAVVEQEMIIVRTCIANWVTQVRLANAVNYFDINKISEGAVMHLLNLARGYALQDLNREKNNFPGIDLGDRSREGFAVQVTSRTDSAKLTKALRLFLEAGYVTSFPKGLRFLIVNEGKSWRIATEKLKPYRNIFDPQKDIWFIGDLINDIQDVYYRDEKLFGTIKIFLQKEFGALGSAALHIMPTTTANQLKFFKRLYQATHEQAAKRFVGFSCSVGGEVVATEHIPAQISQSAFTVIAGASGYGKTLLAKRITLEWLDTCLPLFLRAKYYESGLELLLNKEAAAYAFISAMDWLSTATATGLRPWLIIDGLNECSETMRPRLLAEMELFASTHKIQIIVTTQAIPEQLRQLQPIVIMIGTPDQKTKMAIAGLYSGKPVSRKLETVLSVVTSNIEAQMAGEIGVDDIDRISRFQVFELFIRRKLAETYADGLRLLSAVAATLSRKILFYLPERAVQELVLAANINRTVLDRCLQTGLLDTRMGMYSFGHEMFFNFFVAESIVAAATNETAIIQAIDAPKNHDITLLIIGAIADIDQLAKVLPFMESVDLFVSLWNGEGGTFAQQWVNWQLRKTLGQIIDETRHAVFEISPDHLSKVDFKLDSLKHWTGHENALIYAIAGLLTQGVFLKEFFELTGQMDEKCSNELKRLQDEAKSKGISLRSALFSAAYIGIGAKEAAITKIFSSLHSGMSTFNRTRSVTGDMIKPLLKKQALRFGEFYLLLLLLRWTDGLRDLYPFILSALQKHWRYLPYHLTNEILDQTPHAYTTEGQREELIEALNQMHSETKNIWLSTGIFDALSGLGALADDAEAHIDTVQQEVDSLLASPSDEDARNKAAGIFYAQFDHPYDIAYQRVIEGLKGENQRLFYIMALQGYHSSIFTVSLITHAWKLYGSDLAPYLVRWTATPFFEVSFPQDSLAIFFVSHLLLAKSNYPIVSKLNGLADAKDESLMAAAEIFYWLNRSDMALPDKLESASTAQQLLLSPNNSYAIETIWQSRHSLYNSAIADNFDVYTFTTITSVYKEAVVSICRDTIVSPGNQLSIMQFPRAEEIVPHAIDLLAESGSLVDLDILRPLADHPLYGRDAIRAIKRLSERYL